MEKKARVQFLFTTILLDSLGIGLLVPILPDLIRRFYSDPAVVSQYFGYFISVYSLMQFFASPVLGSLSDRYGRRPVLLVSLLGAGFDYLLMAFAPNLWILFLGRIISGLTGASMTVATSYMADMSDDSNRSSNFGLIGAAWGVGFIAGPALGGVLGSMGWQLPFFAAAILNLLNFAFGYFILPESLPIAQRRNVEFGKLNPLRSIMKVMRPSPIVLLIWIYLLIFLAGQVHPSVWTLYTQHKFNWSAFQVGLSISFIGIAIAAVQGGLTRVVIPRWGEQKALKIGNLINIFGFAGFAFATEGWMMYAILLPSAIAGIVGPAIQSLISREVPPQEQGELQGTLVALASLTAIFGPLFFTEIFAKFTVPNASVYFPGVPYFCAALICVVVAILTLWVRPSAKTVETRSD